MVEFKDSKYFFIFFLISLSMHLFLINKKEYIAKKNMKKDTIYMEISVQDYIVPNENIEVPSFPRENKNIDNKYFTKDLYPFPIDDTFNKLDDWKTVEAYEQEKLNMESIPRMEDVFDNDLEENNFENREHIKQEKNSFDRINNEYISSLVGLIEKNKIYPYKARLKRIEGSSVVGFTLYKDGSISNLKIITSSKQDVLDQAALQAVKKSSPFPVPPSSLNLPRAFKIRIKFKLE